MLGFFSLLALWWLAQERWTRAGLATAVAGASYYLGVILIPIAAVFAASGRGLLLRERARRAALAGGLGALGPVVTELVIWAQTGKWDAFFLLEEPYQHGIRWPAVSLWVALSPLHHESPLALDSAPALQALFVSLVVLAVTVFAWKTRLEPRVRWLLVATTLLL